MRRDLLGAVLGVRALSGFHRVVDQHQDVRYAALGFGPDFRLYVCHDVFLSDIRLL
jgi:hypothetical protein